MARRNVYTGIYNSRHHRRNHNMVQRNQQMATIKNLRHVANLLSQYVWTAYGMVNGNYVALVTVFAVVLLSFLIPDISQKIHATNELKSMKNVLNVITVCNSLKIFSPLYDKHTMTMNHGRVKREGLRAAILTSEAPFMLLCLRLRGYGLHYDGQLACLGKEVTRAEVACLTAADEICYLQCSMQDGATETKWESQTLSECTSHCMRSTVSEPVQVDGQLGLLRPLFYPHWNTSHKEIAIMSYVYSDSFDAEKTMTINCSTLPE